MNSAIRLNQIFLLSILLIMAMGCKTHKNMIIQQLDDSVQIPINSKVEKLPTPCPVLAPSLLENKKWQLVMMEDKNVSLFTFTQEKPYVTFSVSTSYVHGYSGCNQFGGNCLMGNNTLDIGQLIATKRYCLDVQEPEFLNILKRCNTFCIEKEFLLLKENDLTLLVFEEVKN